MPIAPTGLSTSAVNGQIVLKWTASAGATSYLVRRATSFGGPYNSLASGFTATTYTDTTANANIVYFYVIAVVNAGGTGRTPCR